jgi:PTS system nitrogen regulatory IIA component
MELADILSEESVMFCADKTTKNDVLKMMAERAAHVSGMDLELFAEAIENREALGSTGLGNGIAIPHGKIAGLSGVRAIFMRLDHGVDFDSVDDQPVDLIMMLLAPMGSGADHLKALALVARMLRTESVVDRIRAARDPQRAHDVLTQPLTTHKAA